MTSSKSPDRKELKRAFKEAPVPAGIWVIRNVPEGKVLLGSAVNVNSRLQRHLASLNFKQHDCRELQADWDRLGAAAFALEVAEVLEKPANNPYFDVPGELKRLEKLWLEKLQPYGAKGYHPAPL